VIAGALVIAAFGAGVVGIAITDSSEATALWWPAAGIGLFTLLVLPRRWWPALIPSLTAAYVLANVVCDRPYDAAALLGLSDIAETVLVAVAIDRSIGRQLRTVADFGRLLIISLGGAFVAALGIAATSAALLDGRFGDTLLAVTSSHWTSVVLVAPLALVPRERIRVPVPLAGLQVVLLLTVTLLVFGPGQDLALAWVPIPFLIWAGLSFGYRVVAVELVVMSVLVTATTLAGWGPFGGPEDAGSQVVQLYLISLVLSSLPLSLVVHGQTEATRAARIEKQRTEAVIDSSSTPILVTDSEGTVVSINPATTRLTGFAAEELVGRPFWEQLLPASRQAAVRAQFTNPAKFPEHGESVILTASGGERIVTYSNGVLHDPVDDTLHYVLTATDITSERATSHLLQHLLRSATTVAILGTDRAGAITLVNAGAEAMLRIDGDEAIRRPFLEFLHPEEVARRATESGAAAGFAGLVEAVDADGAPQTQDWTWLPPDGMPVRVSMTTSLIADAGERPIGYLFVARDVTENRRNQEILQRALERESTAVDHLRALDSAKDDFVSTVSHELRTPLTSIVGSTELLTDGLAGQLTPQQRQMVQVIDRNAERLLALVNDLLLLAAHGAATVPIQFAPLDLRSVVVSSHATVMPLLGQRRLHLRPEMPEEPVMVNGDPHYLERAVTNLLTNAIKFTPDGGSIRIRAGNSEDGVSCFLSVSDTGIGIPADELENVFIRFFRSSNVQPDAIQGTGLGLAIVRSIVESHHGHIDVQSEPGTGSTFTITLPTA